MADSGSAGFRSRYAALPGSLSAIRVDYDRNITAFDAPGPDTSIGQNRNTIRRFRQGHRLGDKPEWNGSCQDEKEALFPKRPLMHTLSEYQAVKLNYNYRATTLPDVNKKTVFVPKPNKMQIDQTAFLSEKEKSMVVKRCPATVSTLSALEMKNFGMAGVEKEGGWNCSTQPDERRTNIFKPKEYDDMRALNKAKGLVDSTKYKSCLQKQNEISETMRQKKLDKKKLEHEAQERRQQRSKASPTKGKAFTMSNLDQWYNMDPVETAAQAAGEDGLRLQATFQASRPGAMASQKKPSSSGSIGGGEGGLGGTDDPSVDPATPPLRK